MAPVPKSWIVRTLSQKPASRSRLIHKIKDGSGSQTPDCADAGHRYGNGSPRAAASNHEKHPSSVAILWRVDELHEIQPKEL